MKSPIYIEDRQGDDATRDAIYLFQTKQYGSLPEAIDLEDHGMRFDGEYVVWLNKKDEDGDPAIVSNEEQEEHGVAYHYWRTEAVFATRQEARAWGERREYEWGKEGKGWRTYSVCAEWALNECLSEHWVDFCRSRLADKEKQQ